MRPGRLPRPVFILDTAHAPDCRLGTVTTSVAFLAAIYAVVAYLTVSKADRIAPHAAYRKGRDDEATSPKPLLLAAAGADREADLIQLEQAYEAPKLSAEAGQAPDGATTETASALRKDDDAACHEVIADGMSNAGVAEARLRP